MNTIPIAWFVSILMALAAYVLVWNAQIPPRSRLFLSIFFLCLAVTTACLGMRVAFDWLWPARAQPFVAVLAAPSAYLGFAALTRDNAAWWQKMLWQQGVIVAVAVLGLAAPIPVSADVFLLAINSVYLVRIAGLLSHGLDSFVAVPPHTIGLWRAAIYATIALIGLMVAVDGLVFAMGLAAGAPHLLTLLTGVSGVFAGFVFVVVLVGVPLILKASKQSASGRSGSSDADHAVIATLDAIMKDKELFRDSNLTLARLAKRLSVPARDLSGAINRVTQENFSRYINGHRIAFAQRALSETDLPITEIMYDAGFISKSSFNTEFRRVTGQTPSQFRAMGAGE